MRLIVQDKYILLEPVVEETDSDFVNAGDTDTAQFGVYGQGPTVECCKTGDTVLLRPGNYPRVEIDLDDRAVSLTIVVEDDIVAVFTSSKK